MSTPPPVRYHDKAPQPPEGPLDLEVLLPPGDGPIELDVGFGRGLSLVERAHTAPGSRILGIEIKPKWAFKVAERCAREGLENVRVLCGDARDILGRAGPDGVVQRCFVHFPDPWWKKRHAKRRLVGGPVLDILARLLVEGGDLYVQTDVEARAVYYRDLLREHPAFTLEGDEGFVHENPFGARSNRERRAAEDGLPVYRILARRTAG